MMALIGWVAVVLLALALVAGLLLWVRVIGREAEADLDEQLEEAIDAELEEMVSSTEAEPINERAGRVLEVRVGDGPWQRLSVASFNAEGIWVNGHHVATPELEFRLV
jgi:type II secretory pathway pseudopilin PulG